MRGNGGYGSLARLCARGLLRARGRRHLRHALDDDGVPLVLREADGAEGAAVDLAPDGYVLGADLKPAVRLRHLGEDLQQILRWAAVAMCPCQGVGFGGVCCGWAGWGEPSWRGGWLRDHGRHGGEGRAMVRWREISVVFGVKGRLV